MKVEPEDVRTDLEFVLRSVATMRELRESPDREPVKGHTTKAQINKPTEAAALGRNPAREWLRKYEAVCRDLLDLANKAHDVLGDPVAQCEECRQVIDRERPKKARGLYWHEKCYRRVLRAERKSK